MKIACKNHEFIENEFSSRCHQKCHVNIQIPRTILVSVETNNNTVLASTISSPLRTDFELDASPGWTGTK